MKSLLVGGTASGVGKTTVTMTLIAALRRRGLCVQPFKGGPDFLDTTHHSRIAGRPAHNLDTWMLSHEANQEVLYEASRNADAVVVEGMMGLFDGKDGVSDVGSSAEIAKLLGLPVVLVIDAAKSARSVAAVVLGFESFDPELHLAGVIFNRVASERHFTMLANAVAASCGTPILGWLPRASEIAIPERHLGLHAAETGHEGETLESHIDRMAALAEKHLDMERIIQLAGGELSGMYPQGQQDSLVPMFHEAQASVRIGVPRDGAFFFYYEDNLDMLRRMGAEIVFFSPMIDEALPAGLHALYLGGGYPELHAEQLSNNGALLAEVRAFAASGHPVYAECGGMLYLAEKLKTTDNAAWPMAGILPLRLEMSPRLVDFGYVTVTFTEDCLLGPAGTEVRGHSFHYSRVAYAAEDLATCYSVQYSLSGKTQAEGYGGGSVLASYVHLHFRANPEVARNLVAAAQRVQDWRPHEGDMEPALCGGYAERVRLDVGA